MAHPLPAIIQANIQQLAGKSNISPEEFRNWWDAQITLLLDEFNTFESVVYDDWLEFLHNFGREVSAKYPNQELLAHLLELTKNQLGGMQIHLAFNSVKEAMEAMKPFQTAREAFNKAESIALTVAMPMLQDKWRFNANLSVTENFRHYFSKLNRLYTYRYNSTDISDKNDKPYVSRSLDTLPEFMGSKHECARIYTLLTAADYAEFNQLSRNIPELYARFIAANPGEDEALVAMRNLAAIDLDGKFRAWWEKHEKKIEQSFAQIILPVLQSLYPGQPFTDEQLYEHEKNLRVAFYSFLPEVEVFDEQDLCKSWNIATDDPNKLNFVRYRQFITMGLRALPPTGGLSARREEFLSSLKLYQPKLPDVKSLKEALLEVCVTDPIIDPRTFFANTLKIIDASPLANGVKKEFLDFLIKSREAFLFDATLLKDKKYALAIEIKIKYWLKSSNEKIIQNIDFLSSNDLDATKVLDVVKKIPTLEKQKELIKACIELITGGNPNFKPTTVKSKEFLDTLNAALRLIDQEVVPTKQKISEKISEILIVSKQNLAEKNALVAKKLLHAPYSLDRYWAAIANQLSPIIDALAHEKKPATRAADLVHVIKQLEIPDFLKELLIADILVMVNANLSKAYLDLEAINLYRTNSLKPSIILANAIFDFAEANQADMPIYRYGRGLRELFANWQNNPLSVTAFNQIWTHKHMTLTLKVKLIAAAKIMLENAALPTEPKQHFVDFLSTLDMPAASVKVLAATETEQRSSRFFGSLRSRPRNASNANAPAPATLSAPMSMEDRSLKNPVEDLLYVYEKLDRSGHQVTALIEPYIEQIQAIPNTGVDDPLMQAIYVLAEELTNITTTSTPESLLEFFPSFMSTLAANKVLPAERPVTQSTTPTIC